MYKINIVAKDRLRTVSTLTTIELDRNEYYMMLRSSGRTAEIYERILRQRQKDFDDLSGGYAKLIDELILWNCSHRHRHIITWEFVQPKSQKQKQKEQKSKKKQEPVKQPEKRPEWEIQVYADRKIIIASNDFTHDVWLDMTGDFATHADRLAYAQKLVDKLNQSS